MLRAQAAALKSPNSRESRSFRNRFRVPFPIFEQLVSWTKTWYEVKGDEGIGMFDATGASAIPTELKVIHFNCT
jgi:hypothetical protein